MQKINFSKINRGYTLLFAVLITSVVLSVSVSVLNIARKEVILSGASRDSFSAIYMADGAIECAMAYDRYVEDAFSNGFDIDCGYGNYNGSFSVNQGVETYTFAMSPAQSLDLDNEDYTYPCALVTVTTYTDVTDPNYGRRIEARGYNVGWNPSTLTCDAPHPKRVERAFRYYYKNS